MNAIKAMYGGSFWFIFIFTYFTNLNKIILISLCFFRDIPAIPLLKRECSAQHRRQGSRTICHTGAWHSFFVKQFSGSLLFSTTTKNTSRFSCNYTKSNPKSTAIRLVQSVHTYLPCSLSSTCFQSHTTFPSLDCCIALSIICCWSSFYLLQQRQQQN